MERSLVSAWLALLFLACLVVLALPPIASARQPKAIMSSAGGASEIGLASVNANPSIRDFKATVSLSQSSALLKWVEQFNQRRSVERDRIVIRLDTGQKFEFLDPMITSAVVSGATTVAVKIKHRDGMLMLTVPRDSWEGSSPATKK